MITKLGTRILGTYSIEYENDIKQIKNLISHHDYENIIKPTQELIHRLELRDKHHSQISILKHKLKELFTENWFTNKSPLWNAFHTKKLILPKYQGGITKCNIINIE